jgi:hypothetical protein
MFAQISQSPYLLVATLFVFLGLILLVTGSVALFRAQMGSFAVQGLLSILLITMGALSGTIAIGIQGYQSLTKEEIAAHITITPISPQHFTADIQLKDGQKQSFVISGDELYIDAHILKWQPIANFFGLHTVYELDRIGGRYRDIEQERSAIRSIYSLSQNNTISLFNLRQRYTLLAILLDAKYGSATFIPATQSSELQLRISTTGLLIRELNVDQKQM